jgi:hypothetical protein
MTDRWQSNIVVCKGGQVEDIGQLEQGTSLTGTASCLQNMEPALEGGYERIIGYSKYDATEVPGATGKPIKGCFPGHDGVYAAREDATSLFTDVYYGTGSGWTKVNSANQALASTKYRGIKFSLSEEIVVLCDGQGPALRIDSSQSDTLINGTGAPTAPKFAEFHLRRLALAPASNANSFALSEPDDDDDFDGLSGAIEINTGDKIKGLKVFSGQLYIFCENSIHKLVGNTNTSFVLQTISSTIGCISHDSIQEIGGDVVFLSQDGLRSIKATEAVGDTELALVSSAIQPTVRRLLDDVSSNEDTYSSVIIRSKSQYRLFIRKDGLAEADSDGLLGRLDKASGKYEWGTIKGLSVYSSESTYTPDGEDIVFGHPDTGFVYRMERGDDFDGTAISAIYDTPHLTFEDATIRKVLQKINLHTQTKGNLSLTIAAKLDFEGTGILQPATTIVTQPNTPALYGTALYGTGTYVEAIFPVFRKNLTGSGFTVLFRFTTNDSNPPYRIDSFQLQFAPKGRR